MPYDGEEDGWGDEPEQWEPFRETIMHRHPTLPFIQITQDRYIEAEPGQDRFESWGFIIHGPSGSVGYDSVGYCRGDLSEEAMLVDIACRAEKHLLDDRGPFFVLRMFLQTGEFRDEIDAVMRKHGQWPAWRRVEAAVSRWVGVERADIRLRYRLRGETPSF